MRLSLVGSVAMAAMGSSAIAADHETWRCDKPYGEYDSKEMPISAKSTSVSGVMIFHKANFGPQWNSLTKITFKQDVSSDGDCHCSGIKVIAFPTPETIEVRLIENGTDMTVARTTFEKPIAFKISVDDQGLMTVKFGTIEPLVRTVQLSHPEHDMLAMSCSGADVSFLNIDVE